VELSSLAGALEKAERNLAASPADRSLLKQTAVCLRLRAKGLGEVRRSISLAQIKSLVPVIGAVFELREGLCFLYVLFLGVFFFFSRFFFFPACIEDAPDPPELFLSSSPTISHALVVQ
jgi:hypothetical protein